MNNRFLKFVATVSASLVLTACASMQSTKQEPVIAAETVTETRPDGSIRYDTRSEQVARLWIAAEKARTREFVAQAGL